MSLKLEVAITVVELGMVNQQELSSVANSTDRKHYLNDGQDMCSKHSICFYPPSTHIPTHHPFTHPHIYTSSIHHFTYSSLHTRHPSNYPSISPHIIHPSVHSTTNLLHIYSSLPPPIFSSLLPSIYPSIHQFTHLLITFLPTISPSPFINPQIKHISSLLPLFSDLTTIHSIPFSINPFNHLLSLYPPTPSSILSSTYLLIYPSSIHQHLYPYIHPFIYLLI